MAGPNLGQQTEGSPRFGPTHRSEQQAPALSLDWGANTHGIEVVPFGLSTACDRNDGDYFDDEAPSHTSDEEAFSLQQHKNITSMEPEPVDVTISKSVTGLNPNRHFAVLFKTNLVAGADGQCTKVTGNTAANGKRGRRELVSTWVILGWPKNLVNFPIPKTIILR